MTDRSFGWGVIATGAIATKFAEDLALVAGATPAAVYSRRMTTARDFAEKFGFAAAYNTLDALLRDPAVDAVYVASPNSAHLQQSLAVIEAGKPVVIEKPVTLTAADARTIETAARERGVFAMEAMWARFLPTIQRAKALVDSGAIGDVRRIEARFGYKRDHDPESRLFNRDLGGGALYDLGVYPLSLALMMLGDAADISSWWKAAPTGTDIESRIDMTCGGAEVAIHTGFVRDEDNTFTIFGSTGTLRLDRHFLRSRSISIWQRPLKRVPASSGLPARLDGRATEQFDYPGHGLHFEICAAQAAIRSGQIRSSISPLADSAGVLEIIETVLAQPPRG